MKAALIVTFYELERKPIHDFLRPMQDQFVALKVISGQTDDMTRLLVEYDHMLFSMQVTQGNWSPNCAIDKEWKKELGREHVYPYQCFDVHLWDCSGGIAVYNGHCYMEGLISPMPHGKDKHWADMPLPKHILQGMELKMNMFKNNRVTCADCGTITDAHARSYFAARYCEGCWEGATGQHKAQGGWKAVEAKETYN